MLDLLRALRWQDGVDILVVSYLIYRIILMIRGTRAVQMLAGLAILLVVYFLAREFELFTLYWLLGTFLSSIFLVIIIIFQRDIRRALTQVGQTPPIFKSKEAAIYVLDEVIVTAQFLSKRKIGALIILERETGLKDYLESGHPIDARLSKELLVTLFQPSSLLHDGGVVIRKDRIVTAGCLLPLSKNPYISKELGTRHRAAIGLSEETDAVIIVVSEETQRISLVRHGAITTNMDVATLRSELEKIFVPEEYKTPLWRNWFAKS
ncbi:MAG: diadenylate cyclase CdaA [Thermodesulfobacteriota bacterium]